MNEKSDYFMSNMNLLKTQFNGKYSLASYLVIVKTSRFIRQKLQNGRSYVRQ